MEYTVQKLGLLAGVSTRTLRYYDEIGLLTPARINSSGYRIYGEQEVNRLQQILFYRELGLSLERIRDIINDPGFDSTSALKEHRESLLNKRQQLDLLIETVEKSIAAHERRITMTDQEKFEGFKEKLIEDNEKSYGKEIREKYGDDAVNRSNDKLKKMTAQEHEELTHVTGRLYETLGEAYKTGDPAGELAQKAADLHKQWLCFYWDSYSKEAHGNLAQMYVDDERFRKHYDKDQPGTAEFLRDAIRIYISK
ncbi:MerR family transcriptional regulator [Fictibacillus fluitans]|uniref:MerR family transcriptional regulator n=1 Tax=Fictibacillus fluitans TaxID=3058422 RepID=A0ABT8HZW8_9BACL|nr:MerR family transcriptional regulator [Fictibacillus sp. NE201]MDN4526025.1 MerR family transcriptional regulator [Fictibacillus sp. NE201]